MPAITRALILFAGFALLALAADSGRAESQLHHSLRGEALRGLPSRLLILPAEVSVREISAGGVMETVPAWAEQASANFTRALHELASGRKDFSLVPTPELTEPEKEVIDEVLAAYMVVGEAAFAATHSADSAWAHKREQFDYTLGNGLAFLREKTGADAAVVLVGDDVVSTAERKAAAVVGLFFGVGIPLGRSIVIAGVVDLATGDILWMNHSVSGSYDLKDYESARAMLGEIFSAYPGTAGRKQ